MKDETPISLWLPVNFHPRYLQLATLSVLTRDVCPAIEMTFSSFSSAKTSQNANVTAPEVLGKVH